MDARELEALSMLSRGFIELKEANPELAYNLVLDILSGINEYVSYSCIWTPVDISLAINPFGSTFQLLVGSSLIVVSNATPK